MVLLVMAELVAALLADDLHRQCSNARVVPALLDHLLDVLHALIERVDVRDLEHHPLGDAVPLQGVLLPGVGRKSSDPLLASGLGELVVPGVRQLAGSSPGSVRPAVVDHLADGGEPFEKRREALDALFYVHETRLLGRGRTVTSSSAANRYDVPSLFGYEHSP
jgi:hypothetical protein